MQSDRVSDRGFSIHGMREFEVGDSARAISRRHYVRTGERIIVEKLAEHNAFILVLLDSSASEHIGAGRLKYDVSLELLRHFGEACLWKGNTLQVLAFTTGIELESRLIVDMNTLEEALIELEELKPVFSGTDHREVFDRALYIAGRLVQPADLVCILSDFFFPQPLGPFMTALEDLRDMADVIALVMRDRIDDEMPPVSGALRVRDAETGETFWSCEVSVTDHVMELERHDMDACFLKTWHSESEWFEALADFFTLRMLKR
jgi:uncharacterized protein (DUF58 family)